MKSSRYLFLGAFILGLMAVFSVWNARIRGAEDGNNPSANQSTRARQPDDRASSALPKTMPSRASASPHTDRGQTFQDIEDATVQYSPTELPKFERWLKSPDPAIRAEAADGLLRSGLPGGAELLRTAATLSKDPAEAANYERSAAILELPPATDLIVKALKSDPNRKPLPHIQRPVPTADTPESDAGQAPGRELEPE